MNIRRKKFGPVGITPIASAGSEPDFDKLPESEDDIRITTFIPWPKFTYHCGHKGPLLWKVSIYGIMSDWITPWQKNSECPECALSYIRKNVPRCALCGLPIYEGSPVVLYLGTQFEPKIATIVDDDYVLGCMRKNCCSSPELFCGHWGGEEGFLQYDYGCKKPEKEKKKVKRRRRKHKK